MKVVCVKCESEFKPGKSGVTLVETFGKDEQPYKVWKADLLYCPGCGTEIITGFADRPIKEHFEEGFEDWYHEKKWPKSGNPAMLYYDYERPKPKRIG